MNHLASLYFESHKMDEAEKYGLESISILEKFKNEHPEVVLGYNKSYFREWQAVRSSTDRFLMQFYYKKQEFDKSQFYYRQGIQDSEISGHYGRKARLMSSYALMYKLFPDTDSLIRYAHTTMNFLTSFHELDNERIFADSLSAMFLKLKLPIESASFNSISKQLSDSISKHAAPAETVNKMLLIASAATEQIEKRLSSGEKHHKTVTWLYQLLSFFIAVFSVLMIAAVVVRSRKKRKELAEKNQAAAVSGKNHHSLAKSILLMDQIHQYFRDEKPYLDPKLKVETLAKRMNTSYKSVNNAIVNVGNTSFNTLVNQYRVETAKMYLEDPERMKYKIEAIAHDSGFGSKQSFYNTFEELTGIKPSDFRSNMMKTKNMNSNSAV
jgi:AraC-like DNA-binding protein